MIRNREIILKREFTLHKNLYDTIHITTTEYSIRKYTCCCYDFFRNTDKMTDAEKLPIAIAGIAFITLPFLAGMIALYAAK